MLWPLCSSVKRCTNANCSCPHSRGVRFESWLLTGTVFNENRNCFRESQKLPPSRPCLFSSRHPYLLFTHCLLVQTVISFLPVVAGILTVWWHRTVLEPDKWIFNQLYGRILRPSVPSQVQQQNDRDILSFRYNSSVHCSVQYLQKVCRCCGGFFVTVNLWMYIDEHVHERVHNLWKLKITVGIGTELLFTEKAVARNHWVHCFLFLFLPLQGHTLRTEILLTVSAWQMTVCGTVRRMFALVYVQAVHFWEGVWFSDIHVI